MGELVVIKGGVATLEGETAEKLASYERALKKLKMQEDTLKAEILAEMEAQGIVKLETEEVSITYIAASDRESFDSKALKADMPEIYDEYIRMSPVKASIRVKVV